MAEKRIRNDKFSKEWAYGTACWQAIIAGDPIPPAPQYSIWESTEGAGKERFVGTKPIEPKQVTHQGTTWFPWKD